VKPVEKSSTIEAIGYEPTTQLLKVKFKSGGLYHFDGVSAAEHHKLITAASVGKHFHKHIKGSFKSTKQEEKHG
jgi:hypothetical protein